MIFQNNLIYIEREISEIPWVKIFAKGDFKEITDCDDVLKKEIFCACLITEKTMKDFYNPTKINWASFANYVPKVHIHIMARFKDDSFFPESMWGKKQRQGKNFTGNWDEFEKILIKNLNSLKSRN